MLGIKYVSLRNIVLIGIGVLGLAAILAVGTLTWSFSGNIWPSVGAVLFIVLVQAVVWRVISRGFAAHEHDHRVLPARPEFFDFDLFDQPMNSEELDGMPLKTLSFTVFDTETTGLRPSAGDEMISIGGVRIAQNEVLSEVTFSRLINPGRPIPKESVRFHGITDIMVATEPLATEVLHQFREFVGDSVLIAHNAAFDMKFLKLKEAETGAVFNNIVLDTLLLSVFLDNEETEHSLDAIAKRYGIEIEGRHTALGDSLVTAKVFSHMLDRLEARGITTLYQALRAANKMVHVRKMQQRF
jgi:DNA polymerase III subunit epsilon